MSESGQVGRRDFLKTGAVAAAAGALAFGDWPAEAAASLPKRYMTKANVRCTVLSFGAMFLSESYDDRVLDYAIDQGINLVHVSPAYTNGKAIEVVSRVLKRKRSKVFLALKTSPVDGKIDTYVRMFGGYIDILVPPMTNPGAFNDDNLKSGFARLKQAGKLRGSGFAAHDHQAETLNAARGAGFYDTMLISYNEGVRSSLDPTIATAAKAGMGFMVMKGVAGVTKQGGAMVGAAMRSLLRNTNISTLTIGMKTQDQVKANLQAILQGNAEADHHYARYVASMSETMCTMCGACQDACPRKLAVCDYLRAAMYRERGDAVLADELVAAIPPRKSLAACDRCTVCNQACHRQINVVERMRQA